jgi:hypothetical protein
MGKIQTQRQSMTGRVSSESLLSTAIGLLVFSAVFSALTHTEADPDLWGHLRFGLEVLNNGVLTQVDSYSYLTAGYHWINHEWLAEMAMALTWKAAGSTGLILLKIFLGLLTLGLLYRHMLARKAPTLRAAILLLAGIAIMIPTLITIRPHLFTLLFFILILLILDRAEMKEYHWLWAAPPVFALWANLHGGFLVGLGALGLWLVLHRPKELASYRQILPPVLFSFTAPLLNPYGPALVVFLARSMLFHFPMVSEWQPLGLTTPLGLAYLIFLAISILGLVYSRLPREPFSLALLCIMALLPLIATRHLPLFAITSLVFIGEHVLDAWERAKPDKPWRGSPTVMIAGLSAASLLLLVLGGTHLGSIPLPTRPVRYPVEAVELLKQSEVSGNLAVVHFDWGDYALWHLSPRIKVSIDTRLNMAYPDQVYRENLSFDLGLGDWDALLREHPTDLALINKGATAYNLMKLREDWELVYEDDYSALFVLRSSPAAGPLEQAAAAFTPPTGPFVFP